MPKTLLKSGPGPQYALNGIPGPKIPSHRAHAREERTGAVRCQKANSQFFRLRRTGLTFHLLRDDIPTPY
jgi:hypothetical protein